MVCGSVRLTFRLVPTVRGEGSFRFVATPPNPLSSLRGGWTVAVAVSIAIAIAVTIASQTRLDLGSGTEGGLQVGWAAQKSEVRTQQSSNR